MLTDLHSLKKWIVRYLPSCYHRSSRPKLSVIYILCAVRPVTVAETMQLGLWTPTVYFQEKNKSP